MRPHVHFYLNQADLGLHLSILLLVLDLIVALSSNIIKVRPRAAGRSQSSDVGAREAEAMRWDAWLPRGGARFTCAAAL